MGAVQVHSVDVGSEFVASHEPLVGVAAAAGLGGVLWESGRTGAENGRDVVAGAARAVTVQAGGDLGIGVNTGFLERLLLSVAAAADRLRLRLPDALARVEGTVAVYALDGAVGGGSQDRLFHVELPPGAAAGLGLVLGIAVAGETAVAVNGGGGSDIDAWRSAMAHQQGDAG